MYKRIRDLRKNRHLTQKQIGQIYPQSSFAGTL